MKTSLPRRTLSVAIVIGIPVILASGTTANAQATYNATLDNNVTSIYGAIYPNTSPHYDTINLAAGNATVLSVDQNVSFNGSALSNVFTSTVFTSTGGRVAASMIGTDEFFTPVNGRTFVVQNFALDNVDFTTSNGTTGDVTLKIQGLTGGDTSLTLANSSIASAITPQLYAPSVLAFNVSGTSQIKGWQGNMASATNLTVASGGAFRIKDSGLLNPSFPVETLNFYTDANHAILTNSTLILDNSNVRWGSSAGSGSEITLSSSSSLQMTAQSKLFTQDLSLGNSSVTMDNGARIDVHHSTELDNSSVTVAPSASLHTGSLIAKGNATVSLDVNGLAYAGTLDIRANATATVVGNGFDIGEMTVSSQVLFPTSGTGSLVLGNLEAVLNLTSAATMDVTSHAIVTNNGSINLQQGHVTVRQGSVFTNSGELVVQDASSLSVDGNATIGGNGAFNTSGTLSFTASAATPAVNSLSVYSIGLQSPASGNSTLQMAIDPTGLTADRLVVSQQLALSSRVALSLSVANDTALAPGTKFLLVDYPSLQSFSSDHFSGLTDGTVFSLGLNTYRINYNDPDVQPGQTHFITVTAVPEPSTLALLGLGALALAGRAVRRR